MNTDFLKALIEDAVEVAKVQAIEELKKIDTTTVKELVKAEVARVVAPLETEITFTQSWWVKIRNRFYIIVLNRSIDTIVDAIEKKIKGA